MTNAIIALCNALIQKINEANGFKVLDRIGAEPATTEKSTNSQNSKKSRAPKKSEPAKSTKKSIKAQLFDLIEAHGNQANREQIREFYQQITGKRSSLGISLSGLASDWLWISTSKEPRRLYKSGYNQYSVTR